MEIPAFKFINDHFTATKAMGTIVQVGTQPDTPTEFKLIQIKGVMKPAT